VGQEQVADAGASRGLRLLADRFERFELREGERAADYVTSVVGVDLFL